METNSLWSMIHGERKVISQVTCSVISVKALKALTTADGNNNNNNNNNNVKRQTMYQKLNFLFTESAEHLTDVRVKQN